MNGQSMVFRAARLCGWRTLTFLFACCFGFASFHLDSSFGEERLVLPEVGELVVDTEEARRNLLLTELAVSRQLIGRLCEIVVEESEAMDPATMALMMTDRMVAAARILEQLEWSIPDAAWGLRRDQAAARRDAPTMLSDATAQCERVLKSIDAALAALDDTLGAELRALQVKQLALLRQHLQNVQRNKGSTIDDKLQALDNTVTAELQLSRTQGERIVRREQHVLKLTEALDYAEREYQAGLRSRSVTDRIRIAVVGAEIALLRERSQAEAP